MTTETKSLGSRNKTDAADEAASVPVPGPFAERAWRRWSRHSETPSPMALMRF